MHFLFNPKRDILLHVPYHQDGDVELYTEFFKIIYIYEFRAYGDNTTKRKKLKEHPAVIEKIN